MKGTLTVSETTQTETHTVAPKPEPVTSVTQVPNDVEADNNGHAENVDTTVLQKHVDRVTELEKERDSLKIVMLRHRVATQKGVPADLLTGVTEEEFEIAADALLAFKEKPAGPIVPADGTASTRNGSSSDWLRRELAKK
jgi:hypothetical protein